MQLNLTKNKISQKKLLVLDGIGALLSAFFLGVILVQFQSFFGIPKNALYFLAAIPIFFALYDFICYGIVKENHGRFLKIIAYMNMAYCGLSLGVAFLHTSQLTIWGWAYIIVEIIIVMALAFYEIRVANKSKNSLV